MASKRFLMVPEDSSAARMPLPGATMAVAILLSSVRFIERSSQNDSALACENRPLSGNCRDNVGRRGLVVIPGCAEGAGPESITPACGYGLRASPYQAFVALALFLSRFFPAKK